MPTEVAPPLEERSRVGLALRAARKEAGLTTAKAAELGGVSGTQLGAIERGEHSLTSMSAGNLGRLPAAFGLNWPQFVALIEPVYGSFMPFIRLTPLEPTQRRAIRPARTANNITGDMSIPAAPEGFVNELRYDKQSASGLVVTEAAGRYWIWFAEHIPSGHKILGSLQEWSIEARPARPEAH